jgi:hypothetical protein
MQETWDVSALIDKGTRIREARGMTMHHLGMELRQIANRAFIDFVTPTQRAWFRRCMAKLTAGQEMGIIAAELETGADTPQPFFVTARPAKAAGQWWLMLTANLPAELRPSARRPDKPALATGHEFMLMAESAAHLIGDRLDLMRVNAAILGNETAASPQVRADLQADFDEIVLGSAYDGIASRNGASEYLLLRERGASSGALLQQLGVAAEQRAIPSDQIGLETNSLQLSVLGEPLNPANIRRAASSLRQGNQPVKEWEGVVMRQPFWLRPSVLAAGLLALVAIGWLLT